MAIRIDTGLTDRDLTGRSHWWGAPDMPEGMAYPCIEVVDGDGGTYPEPLTFVCQIRCKDIAGLDPDGLLPHSGMLYFFAPIDYFLGDDSSPLDYHDSPAVIYTEREDGLVPYELCWEGMDEIRQAHPGCLALLQIDEEDRWGLRFYDCGMYYFLIRPGDLKARRWERVEGDLYFY